MERIQEIIKLLEEQERLQYDNSISDEMFYYLDEKISNEIANEYTVEEIEEATKLYNKEVK